MNFRTFPCISAAFSLKLSICCCAARDKDLVSNKADESLLPFSALTSNFVRRREQYGPTEMFPSQYFKGLSSRYSFAIPSFERAVSLPYI